MDTILTVKEAAEYLKIHPETLRMWLRGGKINAVKVGVDWRIYQSALDDFLSESDNSK
jgi:excisionase family DNA binding protein